MPPVIIPSRNIVIKCPSCKEPEDKVVMCRRCDYEYKEEYPYALVSVLLNFITVFGVSYLFRNVETYLYFREWWFFPTFIVLLICFAFVIIAEWELLSETK